ncbi:hypothetical protein [Gephyromycinifex aptenodytis]|uniref:hypothetical protein n=1 Tax=Gephyromycinifex aptenodytis TaxID=2716227 RepID=UPI0014483898|nr:hypothetical protein [Gephyromycinifex aptenodytis]
MKIVFMDTGRGTHRGAIDMWRAKLALEPQDTVSMLSWNVPREPLPITEHLVFGPKLRPLRSEPRRCRTAFGLFDDSEVSLSEIRLAEQVPQETASPREPGLAEEELATQLTEQNADEKATGRPEEAAEESVEAESTEAAALPSAEGSPTSPEEPDKPVDPVEEFLVLDGEDFLGDEEFDEAVLARRQRNRTAAMPVYHPARLRQAAKWRVNKARLLGKRAQSKLRRELKSSNAMPVQVAARLASDGVSAQFAAAAARSRHAKRVFAEADVVVPLDYRSQRAAWVLAQQVPGPDVIVGLPAAARVIADRRAEKG